ncbi:MAG: efflux RND transporter permease subunit [Acidobacteriota bacterium]|nr:MAG: efflux RND transporter permease subunit [Acidobacteriota bacterium]
MGLAGRMARFFIDSKLTPLVVLAALLVGLAAVMATPKEEEPQIVVPMMDVMVGWPGADSRELENRITIPMEKKIWEIPGVEYVYSITNPESALLIVRFYVGEDVEDSLVRLCNKLYAFQHELPEGSSPPMILSKTIDDVPVLALTFWGEADVAELRAVVLQVDEEIKQIPDVSETNLHGGLSREVRVELDAARMAANGVDPAVIHQQITNANTLWSSGDYTRGNAVIAVETGRFLESAEEVGRVVVGVSGGRPVHLDSVAEVSDGTAEPREYVFFGAGEAWEGKSLHGLVGAVTLSASKRPGANATELTHAILEKVDALKGRVIPSDINVTVTRDYGETAAEKSRELIKHLLIATFSVVLLIAIALGWRESIVVGTAIPVTLALTLFIYYAYGYTLNRVTLFALIFSIGILVDDAIVVVENIHRHFVTRRDKGESLLKVAVEATDEVGNPTILATFAVIAAILPMAFVTGLMGPYMEPIPVGASVAMLFSLLIAFMISPWVSYRVLRNVKGHGGGRDKREDFLTGVYRRIMGPLLGKGALRLAFFGGVVVLLLAAMSLFYFGSARVKMLPFDNKSEFQVVIDMPEGTPAERTLRVAREMADAMVEHLPELANYQIYVANSAPFNFNGLVRHYFLRREPHLADIQVNLVAKHDRDRQSHEIAKSMRPRVEAVADRHGAAVKVVEIPPGPPVLSTLVAEIYGPDVNRQREIAADVKRIFEETPGVVDVDWYVESPQEKIRLEVDQEKAALRGVAVDHAAMVLRTALEGMPAGLVHLPREKEDVPVMLRLPEAERSSVDDLKNIRLAGKGGSMIALEDIVRERPSLVDQTRYRKNLQRVVYVIGDMAGVQESPVYGILAMKEKLKDYVLPEGYTMRQWFKAQPFDTSEYSVKWDGEWQITYEVFRDLGIAFGVVLVLIFILVVAWFQSFKVPLVIMAPIPLTLVGIVPGHVMFGAFFTATSMIGFIAGAGIIVRNSIILVDFIQLKQKEGMSVEQAVVEAGAVRFRPMLLTASAVIVGSIVILFDPIFQGLAISLMTGEIASTLLSRFAVPLLYFDAHRKDKGMSA